MASQDVCIVLNDREPGKARIAQAIALKLEENNITVSCISPDPNIEKIIATRSPKVVVLDYVIGDYTTGLDIIENFSHKDDRPTFIFLTDEPSVPVAVDAMRHGARHYIELDSPEAANLVIEEIKLLLKESIPIPSKRIYTKPIRLKDLIAQAKASVKAMDQLRALAKGSAPLTIVCGPTGSGRSVMAEALFRERNSTSFLKTVDDWGLCREGFEDLFGFRPSYNNRLSVGDNLSINIDRVSLNDGGLRRFLEGNLKGFLCADARRENNSFIVIGTTEEECALAWQRIFNCHIVFIPGLSERREDISPLARLFITEASAFNPGKALTFDTATLTTLAEYNWPENVRQLKAVVTDAAMTWAGNGNSLNERIVDSYERSIDLLNRRSTYLDPNPMTVLNMIDRAGGDIRSAAAVLGLTTYEVEKIQRDSTIQTKRAGVE